MATGRGPGEGVRGGESENSTPISRYNASIKRSGTKM